MSKAEEKPVSEIDLPNLEFESEALARLHAHSDEWSEGVSELAQMIAFDAGHKTVLTEDIDAAVERFKPSGIPNPEAVRELVEKAIAYKAAFNEATTSVEIANARASLFISVDCALSAPSTGAQQK